MLPDTSPELDFLDHRLDVDSIEQLDRMAV